MAKVLGKEGSAGKAKATRLVKEERTAAIGKKPRSYVVQSGDSLSEIAKALLGDAGRWPEIFEANKDQISDPDQIQPGQELIIPR